MCGRFTQNYTWSEVHAFLSVFGAARNLRPRYNIAPTTSVNVVRLDRKGHRELVSMRWGLVPFFWKKGLKDVPEGEEVLSCTILVSGASAWMAPCHDRMPVLLGAADFDSWLSGEMGAEALRPAAEEALREWIVSKRVNRTGVGDDDPMIIEPVGEVA